MSRATATRSPATVGYAPWLIHRLTAVLLVGLLAVHIAVQVFGVTALYGMSIYQPLLDLTLVAVFTHGFLGARATLLETTWNRHLKRVAIWVLGLAFTGIIVVRIIG